MYKITSQLCEFFDCTNQQLEESDLLDQFNEWQKDNPDQVVSHSIEYGEIINREIAERFLVFYKKRTQNQISKITPKIKANHPTPE
ncbi:MAG: hypothetical protein ABGY08_05565 [Gammaproteobacteria bacterium]